MRPWCPPVWWAALAAAGYPRTVLTPEHDGVATVVVIEVLVDVHDLLEERGLATNVNG